MCHNYSFKNFLPSHPFIHTFFLSQSLLAVVLWNPFWFKINAQINRSSNLKTFFSLEIKLQSISSASLSLTVYQCTIVACMTMILWSRDQLTKIQTFYLGTSIYINQCISDAAGLGLSNYCQPLENIGNLEVLDKLMFQRMITRHGVAGTVLKHLCRLLTDWLVNWVTLFFQNFS